MTGIQIHTKSAKMRALLGFETGPVKWSWFSEQFSGLAKVYPELASISTGQLSLNLEA